jgi:hypothetical protein
MKLLKLIPILLLIGGLSSISSHAITILQNDFQSVIEGILNPEQINNGEKNYIEFNQTEENETNFIDYNISDIVKSLLELENIDISKDLATTTAKTILNILGKNATLDEIKDAIKALDEALYPDYKIQKKAEFLPENIYHLNVNNNSKATRLGEIIGETISSIKYPIRMLGNEKSSKDSSEFFKQAKELFESAIKGTNVDYNDDLDPVYQLHVATRAVLQTEMQPIIMPSDTIDPKDAVDICYSMAKAKKIYFYGKGDSEGGLDTAESAIFTILREAPEGKPGDTVSIATNIINNLDKILLKDKRFQSDKVNFDINGIKEGTTFGEAVNLLIKMVQELRSIRPSDPNPLPVDPEKYIEKALRYAVNHLDLNSDTPLAEQFKNYIEEFLNPIEIQEEG